MSKFNDQICPRCDRTWLIHDCPNNNSGKLVSKYRNKLTKEQVMNIPKLLETCCVREVAEKYNITWQAVWYWVKKLRSKGIVIKTRSKGRKELL